MRLRYSITIFLGSLIVSASLGLTRQAMSAEIHIGGTGNALATMRLLAEAYTKSHPDVKIVVLSSIGTLGAIKAVPTGAIAIGLASRALTEEEAKTGISTSEYARTPTVFAVQQLNRTPGITLQQIADIYSGKMTHWPDGTLIRPILRQPGDDNAMQTKALSADIEKALIAAEQRPGMAFAITDQEAADKMERIQGSLGVTALSLILSEKRDLRPLALGGVEPTPENARSGRYPIRKQFYFVLPKEPIPAAQDFLKFVKSPAGREILKKNRTRYPLSEQPWHETSNGLSGSFSPLQQQRRFWSL